MSSIRGSSIALLVLAGLFLTSCSTPPDVREIQGVRGVLSGKRAQIEAFFNVSPACVSGGYPTIKVLQSPEHGKISVEEGVGAPIFNKEDPRAACSVKTFPGTIIYYTPEADFTGPDAFAFERIGVTGGYGRYRYRINVR